MAENINIHAVRLWPGDEDIDKEGASFFLISREDPGSGTGEFGGKVRLILGTCPQKGFVDGLMWERRGIEASLLDPCHVPLLSDR